MIYIKKFDASENKRASEHKAGIELLISSVSAEYGIKVSESDISKNEYGKPFFSDHSNIHFSISHCKGFAACALSPIKCGVDAEIIRYPNDRIAQRLFRAEQLSIYNALPSDRKAGYFTTLWTLMEAYGKYDGRGLSAMKNAPFLIDEQEHSLISACEGIIFSSWFIPEADCIISFCGEKEIRPSFDFTENPYI